VYDINPNAGAQNAETGQQHGKLKARGVFSFSIWNYPNSTSAVDKIANIPNYDALLMYLLIASDFRLSENNIK
jgi:hypothetical protein